MSTSVRPLLSICIPSTNQPNELKRLLSSIHKYGGKNLEIIIHDGAVNDDSKKVVEYFANSMPITYIKRVREFDDAVIEMVGLAKGLYIWGIGDDDLYYDSIANVERVITENPNLDFIFANYEIGSSGVLHSGYPSGFFKSREDILEKIGTGIGFGPSCIYKADFGKRALETANKFIGSGFMSLYFPLFAISYGSNFFHLRGPIVRCYPTETEIVIKKVVKNGHIENLAFQYFGVNLQNMMLSFKSQFNDKALKSFLRKNFASTWRGVLVGSAGGWDTPKGKRILLIKNFYYFPEAWLALLLFLIPSFLHRSLYGIYSKLKKAKSNRFPPGINQN